MHKKLLTTVLAIIVLLLSFISLPYYLANSYFKTGINPVAFAEEEEEDEDDEGENRSKDGDEHENEDEDEDDGDDDDYEYDDDEYYEYVEVYTEIPVDQVIENQTQEVYVDIIDQGYNLDSDGDGLVDAVDPDPSVHQKMYFSDSDGDSVADVFDRFPNEDDFKYFEDEDSNGNGILDSYE